MRTGFPAGKSKALISLLLHNWYTKTSVQMGNSPDKTLARPSLASCSLTFVLISRPLRYAAMLFKPEISSATVTDDKETKRN